MRRRIRISANYPPSVLAVALLFCVPGMRAQTNKSQVVYLPDPTPRKTELGLLYGDDAAAKARADQTLEARNARRQQLVRWAADELVVLSSRLEADLSQPKTALSQTSASANAEKIELIAKNLKTALQAR